MSPPDAPQASDRPAAPGALTGLNPVQSDAVTHAEGPLLVVAGAGSGKTRVLTHRIAHLIRDRGVSPFAILAITFTNKAADEMKSRVAALVGPVAEKMWVSTFHSACVRILRRDADLLGYPRQFTIYDEADAVRLTGYVIRDLGLDTKRFPPRSIHAAISAAKNDGVDAETYTQKAGNLFERKIGQVFAEYQSRLQRAGSMDFDDLLTNALRLLREHPQTLRHYQERFQHILVDEYQDTNRVQNELVLLLAADHRNIAVVGDQDQCLPPGTPVSTADGPRPIEALRQGDAVIGIGATGRPVPNRVSAVPPGHYTGRMYTVHAGGHTPAGDTTSRGAGRHVARARPLHRLPDGAHRPRLPAGADQERPARRARPVRAGHPGAHQSGACGPRLGAAGVRHPGGGGLLRGLLCGDVWTTDGALPRAGSQPHHGRRVARPAVR